MAFCSLAAQADPADQIDQLAQAGFIQRGAGVILWQDIFQYRVIPLDGDHAVIQEFPDLGLFGLALQERPARFLRHPEHILRQVFVPVFGVGVFFFEQLSVDFFERIGNIFQEDQPQHHVLVLRRIHVAAQLVRCRPELGFEIECCAVGFCFCFHRHEIPPKNPEFNTSLYNLTGMLEGHVPRGARCLF